ncbi:MAG: 4-phosphoerythronate dehydrogenase [Prevotella sp.]|nr:4-phosphoerythronate dehydrogenase [Bacteroides sp.]MCM1366238.1 4-phosphoerythronate dehydrogenase [Prevotella sp.]MCM1436357.1 4-phosphoerythronate dehydrogenase [Prevotella sp.]
MNIISHTYRPLIIADRVIPFLKGRLESYADVRYLDGTDFTAENLSEADALIIHTRNRITSDLLKGSQIKYIVTATIGTDHIDIPWCEASGIKVENAAGCNAPGVAQWVWSNILSQGMTPDETTVGVVGVGNVGKIVGEWGKNLGFNILVNDPPREKRGESPEPIAAQWTGLEELLQRSDIITFHTPLTRKGEYPTYHLLNRELIEKIPAGRLILNAARGGVIDEEALLPYLTKSRLTAILDTWEGEPNIKPETLGAVLLGTPHIAGYSLEGKQRATRMAVEGVCRHFSLPLPDLSDLAAPYNGISPTAQEIEESYSPIEDSLFLYRDPEHFDRLRTEYDYRPEPKVGKRNKM